jgi:multidrug transporter EmrE-like cation transporter
MVGCCAFAASIAFGQTLFKLAAGDVKERLHRSWLEAALSPWLVAAIILYIAATVLWVAILTLLPLTRAYPFALLGAAMVPLLAHMVFGETLAIAHLARISLMLVGLFLTQLE